MILALVAAALAAPLTLDEVLDAVDSRVPQLASAEAKQDAAEAKVRKARGAFDPTVSSKVGGYAGKDPRQVVENMLAVSSPLGPSLEAGHGLGRGEFPPYDGDRETLPGGEWRIRGTVPVLDGLLLSDERTELRVAQAGVAEASAAFGSKRVDVRYKAASTYWKWVAAGARLAIAEDLLGLAVSRGEALTREVEQGTRPRLDQLDNERVILERRDKVAKARAKLDTAALELGLWLRDEEGRVRVPDRDALPELAGSPPVLPEAADDLGRATAHPDVLGFDAVIEASRAEQARARNAVLPTLDLVGEAIRPLDPEGKPELYAGAAVKLPTLLRKERGERDRAGAMVHVAEQARRGVLDGTRAEIGAARVAVDTAWQRVELTRDAASRAAEVLQLERRRFDLGGGDIFVLLGRESALAKAREAAVDALEDYQLALARRAAAIAE